MRLSISSKMAKRSVAVVATLGVAAALSGCAPASTESSSEVTTITVQQQANWAGMMDVLVKAFEKENPDIKVDLQIISDDQKATTNAQVVTGNNPPDVALVPTNSTTYTAALAAEALTPLDDVWKNQNLDERYGAATAASLKYQDKPYVVTIDSIYYNVVFYNKALFEAAGITAPADNRIPDTATLISMADKLRASGVEPLAINGKDLFMYGWMMDQLLQSSSTPAQIENYLTNFDPDVEVTANFTDAPFTDSVAQLDALFKGNVFQNGFLAQDSPTAQALFFQAQAGMLLGGNFSVGDITKNGFEYGWMLLPPAEGGAKVQIPTYNGDSMAIPKNAKNIDAAKKFLEFWMSDDMQSAAVTSSGFALPAVNTVDITSLTDIDPIVSELIADVAANGGPVGWTSAVPGAFGQTTVGTNLQGMMAGTLTPKDVADKQEAALETVRKAG